MGSKRGGRRWRRCDVGTEGVFSTRESHYRETGDCLGEPTGVTTRRGAP